VAAVLTFQSRYIYKIIPGKIFSHFDLFAEKNSIINKTVEETGFQYGE